MASQIVSSAIGENTAASGSALISKFKNVATFVNNNPKIKAWTEGRASELAFQIVSDSVICIDDLERISDKFDKNTVEILRELNKDDLADNLIENYF